MRDGEASATARRVAAHRLTLDRLAAPYGDPAADERLARDVAGSVVPGSGPMVGHLAARTSFFDRVVVGALERGIIQVVVAAAGYDGRPLRYARPGVRWFEVDHPATQRDKRQRLERLGIDTAHVAFVAADFTVDDVASGLVAAGLRPEVPALFLCEGVAVYLERAVLGTLLRQLRRVAALGSRLAISLSVSGGSTGRAARRRRFQRAVAALGEPVRTVLTAGDADGLLAATGWRTPVPDDRRNLRDRDRRAGFVLVEAA